MRNGGEPHGQISVKLLHARFFASLENDARGERKTGELTRATFSEDTLI